MDKLFDSLLNEQLSSIEFVQDYLQLHFDGNSLTYYVWPTVTVNSKSYCITEEGYRDAICKLIAQELKEVSFIENRALNLYFSNGDHVSLSLARDASNTEVIEFVYFRGLNSDWFVLD